MSGQQRVFVTKAVLPTGPCPTVHIPLGGPLWEICQRTLIWGVILTELSLLHT